jgi:hypothetical protein
MLLHSLLPVDAIPHSGLRGSSVDYWFGRDGPQQYRERNGHPLYGETDITYRSNKLGYRCGEFDETASIRMLSIGCSWAYGVGVPQEIIFHERFAARLRQELKTTVVNWNLGLSGISNDSMARMLHLCVPKLDPDIVLVLFTYAARREYVAAHGRRLDYFPNYPQINDLVLDELAMHFKALSSTFDDQLNLFRNYMSIKCLLKDRPWYFSMTVPQEMDLLSGHLDPAHQVAAHQVIDKGRDHVHPGPETHQSICDLYWEKFTESGLAELRCLNQARSAGAG